MRSYRPVKKRRHTRGNRRLKGPVLRRAAASAARVGRVALVAVGVPLAVFGVWKAYSFATTNDYIPVRAVTVTGAGRVGMDEVAALAGIRAGQNILSFSTSDAEARIKGNPWIEAASVRRTVTGEVEVAVRERRPVALVRMGELYVMDSSGVVFKRLEALDGLDLPVVTGLTDEVLKAGTLDSRLLELIACLDSRRGFAMKDVSEINVDRVYGLTVVTLTEGVRLGLGAGAFDEKLASFERLVASRGGSLSGIEAIDLNDARSAVVRFKVNVVDSGKRRGAA